MEVSVMAKNLMGSEIIKIGGEINDMIKRGEKICNLTIGDFNPSVYPIPQELQDEIVKAYQQNQTNYPPANGMLHLREVISDFLHNRLGLHYAAEDIQVAGGSRPLIYATYLSLVDQGDTVVFPSPSWNNNHYCHFTGAKQVMIETKAENNFMPTADEIAPAIKGASLLALCSPLNPTGTMFTKKDLEEICDLVIAENKTRGNDDKPLYILYDQIYWLLSYGDHKHYDPVTLRPELKDYVIYIGGISKAFAATGVRVGWAFGPSNVIKKIQSILGHVGAWAPKAEQVATANYLLNTEKVDAYVSSIKNRLQNSLDALYKGFKQLKADGFDVDAIEPMGAIYLTIKVNIAGKTTPDGNVLLNSKDINSYLINEAKVALVPFSAFGSDEHSNWFRASVGACSLEDIEDSIPRIKLALAKLS